MSFEQTYTQQQKQSQKLAMTQQLQQSIQMLNMNQEELVLFLKQKALGNPLIEVKVKQPSMTERQINHSPTNTTNYNPIEQLVGNQTSLFASVIDQIHLTMRDTYLRELVLWLTSYLDENGYMTISLSEAKEKTGAQEIQLIDALTLLQQLEPAGIGARNLQECLMLQTERDNEAPNLAYLVLEESFELFSSHKWEQLAKHYSVPLSTIQEISDYVQTLTAHPGSIYNDEENPYIRPDLIVEKADNQLSVVSAKTGLPIIKFQQDYYQDMLMIEDVDVKQFIHEKYAEYEWIQRSLLQREETIIRVGTAIVEKQKDFFFKDNHPLIPMTLKEIAQLLDIHESTVSRSVNDKYFQTDFGVYEMRSFFTTGLKQSVSLSNEDTTEQVISSEEVKSKIKVLIAEENKLKPLSDQKISNELAKEGITISRRTVTKYRESLSIPTSTNRKRYT
ncbi:RNA polymerase factor sigma-54 [Desemzia sp. RIT804]|uniref:RNA polymerase factor sigma-54 n=1 Tax=Desemzia sp. RIT 804 TaxID=2810209 RepID=UPI00194F5F09|nr:RNA polymerase factor sigma-54 [Desemzia sp. RIT 804]MBM6615695.1 RNA polymerase factor sigma-54 [Desemzia sp. RIT 804]